MGMSHQSSKFLGASNSTTAGGGGGKSGNSNSKAAKEMGIALEKLEREKREL